MGIETADTQKPTNQNPPARSIKDVTIGQVADSIELLKKFWPFVLGAGMIISFLIYYVAPNSAVKRLACAAEYRVAEIKNNASATLLENQRTDYLRQQTSLRELQTILLKVQLSNRDSGLDLTILESGLETLVDEAEAREKELSDKIEKAKADIESIKQKVESCERSGP